MGGGNGQKAKMAREKNSEKLKGPKGSQLDSNKKAMNIQEGLAVSVSDHCAFLPCGYYYHCSARCACRHSCALRQR